MRYTVIIALLIAPWLAATAAAGVPPGASAGEPATSATSASAPARQLAPADRKRLMAVRQYQHDLVSVLVLRADPDYLLGAAILAKPFEDQPAGLDFDALSARAAASPGVGPVMAWARLGVCHSKADCPNPKAFAKLRQHASNNAAVWLVALGQATARKDAKAEQDAFAKAVAASMYDDYYGKALAAVAAAVTALPPLADTMQGAHDGQPDNTDSVRAFVTARAMRAHPRPNLKPLVERCNADSASADTDLRHGCLKLAHTLQWGSSPVARAVGLHIQSELDPASKARNEQARRDLAWQVKQYSGLIQHAFTDASLASHWLAAARNGGTELSLMLATLRANHIPLEAPPEAVRNDQ